MRISLELESDMTHDRASAVATALVAIFVQHLRSGALHKQLAEKLQDEFAEIQQQALSETRVEDPHE
jgi:hypothetical protein